MTGRFFIVVLIAIFLANAAFAQSPLDKPVSCECEGSSCGACEMEAGVSFYSAKCGANNERVKSCKRPKCMPVENQKQCFALLGKSQPGATAQSDAKPAARDIASANVQARAGVVEELEGVARLIRATGPVETPRDGVVVYVGDSIETKANGKVRVRLADGSDMTIAANSRVKIDAVKVDEKANRRNIALDLVMGKVRSKVTRKYEGDNSFTIKTRTAVAGVRGTDFVASFQPGGNDKDWVSEIRTFEGMVRLETARAPGAPEGAGKGINIPGGTYAAFVVGPTHGKDSEEEFFKSLEQGAMTPVFKMNEEEIRSLKEQTDFVAAAAASEKQPERATAGVDKNPDLICQAPAGKFNQCSFTCEGANLADKRCSSCVRRLCRANGSWVEPSRLPASESVRCQPGRTIVGDCGTYW